MTGIKINELHFSPFFTPRSIVLDRSSYIYRRKKVLEEAFTGQYNNKRSCESGMGPDCSLTLCCFLAYSFIRHWCYSSNIVWRSPLLKPGLTIRAAPWSYMIDADGSCCCLGEAAASSDYSGRGTDRAGEHRDKGLEEGPHGRHQTYSNSSGELPLPN